MSAPRQDTQRHQASTLGDLLRHTRERCRLSQWAMALRLDVSARHVSFLETGRSRPSRRMLDAWLTEVGASPATRSAAMLEAGFALSADDAAPHFDRSVAALRQMLDLHDPAPAIAFDADWRAFQLNRGGRWLSSVVMPGYWAGAQPDGVGLDMIAATAHADGLLSRMASPRAAAAAILAQVRAEAWTNPRLTSRADAFERACVARFGALEPDARAPSDPQLQHVFHTPVGVLRFYTIQAVFGLPQDVTVASLRAELWFPSDAATRAVLQRHVPARAD